MKLKWKVAPPLTGRYRSFYKRDWPSADYEDGRPAINITCDDAYVPSNAKNGSHSELSLYIADYSAKPSWVWRKLKQKAKTLKEAKELAEKALDKFKHFVPQDID